METNYFEQFRNDSLSQLKSLKPEDVAIFDNELIPENYTLVVHPDEAALQKLQTLIDNLRQLEPNQYFYPLPNLHLTIIGNIPITVDPEVISEAVERYRKDQNLRFELKGFGSNQFCSSISAYPLGFSVHQLRDNLRTSIGFHGDDFSRILESYEYVGWINYLRYLQPPSQEFLDWLYQERDTVWGHLQPTSVQLYRNKSKVLDPSEAKLIKEFPL